MAFNMLLSVLLTSVFSMTTLAQDAGEDIQGAEEASEDMSAEAQEVQAPAPTSSRRVEKLEVTGSHIKRIDVEGPSPVVTIDKEALDRSGFNNVGDVLREASFASSGAGRENALSGGAFTGASTSSMRGFGADRILVLLDGKRLPTIGGTSSVDTSLIPMAAVERIEVLKDGASATYGSDALGGVINIITRKDFDGAMIELNQFMPENPGGMQTDLRATYGKTFNKGSILGALQYRNNQATMSRDYDYARPRLNDKSILGSPGSWIDPNNGVQAGSGSDPCPSDQINQDGFCSFDFSPYSQVLPDIQQYSALLNADYQVTNDITFYATGVYTRRDVQNQLAPAPDRFRDATSTGGFDSTIPQSVANGWGLGATGDPSQIFYRLVEEAGPRRSSVVSDSFNINTGLRGEMGDTWDWEFSLTHGASDTENRGVSGYANKRTLHNMAIANPTEFNPFLPPGSKSDVSQALYQPVDNIFSSMTTVNIKASGEIAELPAGPLSLAVGAMNAWQTFEQTADDITNRGEQWGGGVSATGKGLRDFQSAYMELAIPILENLEMQAAGRFDHFSDFGSTINPKLGLRYKPLDQLMLRGSWGTGFRAPALDELYRGQLQTFPFGEDPITGQSAQFETTVGGNRDLREETTQSVNLGAVWQIVQELSLTLDYWYVDQDNVVTQASLRDIFRAEQAFGNSYLNDFGIQVIRDPANANRVDRIVNPSLNLSSRRLSGLDIGMNFQMPVWGEYRFRANVDHAIIFNSNVEPFPGIGLEQRVGFAGFPVWRNNINLGLGNRTYDFSATIRTIGETNYSANAPEPGVFGKNRDHTELDLRVQYTAPWEGTFAAMVRNVFDTDRPWNREYLGAGYLNTSLYDPFGRTFVLNYQQPF